MSAPAPALDRTTLAASLRARAADSGPHDGRHVQGCVSCYRALDAALG